MRIFELAILFGGLVLQPYAQQGTKSGLTGISDGTLVGNRYTNDSVGVAYQVPDGWKATPDPAGPTNIDPRGAGKAANRCTKVLLTLSPESHIEGKFTSAAILFAVDAKCLGTRAFPQSPSAPEVLQVAKRIGDTFNYTAYLSPYGNGVHPRQDGDRVVIDLSGELTVNAWERGVKREKEPLRVVTSLSVTESNGWIVAWGFAAEEPLVATLRTIQIGFRSARPASQYKEPPRGGSQSQTNRKARIEDASTWLD